ncbi:hypothetical protein GCM10027422_03430 [Hymenobacter arcticus]
MKNADFFNKQTISSRIKANIVSEYFPDYCKIISSKIPQTQFRYIDLFSGPGLYKDGNASTPLLVADKCFQNDSLRSLVKFVFNDNTYYKELSDNFNNKFPKGSFKYKPHFGKSTVGESQAITDYLLKGTENGPANDSPAVLFIDPFGYKGIETKILSAFLKKWGNEIFIFVNTKRIQPALENDKFEELMQELFPASLEKVKEDRRYKQSVTERLSLVVDSLGKEYEIALGSRVYYTSFKFQEEDSNATSHYILHLTKNSKGFDLIKTIYNDFANVGTIFDGVKTYTFDAKSLDNSVHELFDAQAKFNNIEKLKISLYSSYSGKTILAEDLFNAHHKDNLYSRNHYTKALRSLVDDNKLESVFTDGKEHVVSVLLSKYCTLTFK